MKDRRSIEIRKILKKHFPQAKFRVKIEKDSLSEAIRIYTDLLEDFTNEEIEVIDQARFTQTIENVEVYEKAIEKEKKNEEIRQKIHQLLRDFESVSYDEVTGEILGGGNTYLFVEPLK